MGKLAKWQNGKIDKDIFILLILPVCLLYHFILPSEWAEWTEWKNQQTHFHSTHSAHSAILLTLPFHSASRMDKSTKTFSFCSFCSFCHFANFTISFCQQNGQNERNGKIDKDIYIRLILQVCLLYHFILPAEWAEWENRQRHIQFCPFAFR